MRTSAVRTSAVVRTSPHFLAGSARRGHTRGLIPAALSLAAFHHLAACVSRWCLPPAPPGTLLAGVQRTSRREAWLCTSNVPFLQPTGLATWQHELQHPTTPSLPLLYRTTTARTRTAPVASRCPRLPTQDSPTFLLARQEVTSTPCCQRLPRGPLIALSRSPLQP